MSVARSLLGLIVLVAALVSCAGSSGPSKQDLIIGTWSGEFQGQSMTLEYDQEQVTVREFGISFPYEWVDRDHILLEALGQQVRSRVEFNGTDQMTQSSQDGTQVMNRVR